MDQLTEYFMNQTNDSLKDIRSQLEDLRKFKIEMVASARLTSLIVSSICGLITMLATVWLAKKG